MFNIICGVCSIAGLLVSLFTAGKVTKITQTIHNSNVEDHSKIINKSKGNIYNDSFVGRDFNGSRRNEQK